MVEPEPRLSGHETKIIDSCAEIKSDMGICGELYGYAVMIEARYASRWGSQLCTAVSSCCFFLGGGICIVISVFFEKKLD